jgi:anti-sigma B factor antagonist
MGPQLTIFQVGDAPGLVVVSGEIDVYTASDLQDSLNHAAEAAAGTEEPAVTVDLSGVTFVDARGLSVLVAAEAYACVRGVRMLFTGISPGIVRLLRVTGLSLASTAGQGGAGALGAQQS